MNKLYTNWFALGLAACLLVVGCASVQSPSATTQESTPSAAVAPAKDQYTEQVAAGVAYFQKRAKDQMPLVENLLVALKSGDIDRAKQAYIDARPPYEEIEVYALSFEQEDADIDARPYAFPGGETDPDYRSIHKIESLIFRDSDLAAAVPYGEQLIESVKSLTTKLNEPANFNSSLNYQGMLNLANEVPSKKISSEEETWSDQSLLIFKHNWIGIQSQFDPYKKLLPTNLVSEVDQAYKACLATVEPFFTPGQVASKSYSSLDEKQRGAIVAASYRYRDALVKARDALKIPEPPAEGEG
ncbi:MAG: EfeM/EfeO family lipoprotein [Gloeomargaritaceae cyanobacterium C42_A2020_066]|nr:EfeM/EfeO family lipoprotein [Gloeomargaritaceae cyanobacterium C42_A2020_066]